MEDGTVLAPGRTEFAIAVGTVPRGSHTCPDDYDHAFRDAGGRILCERWSQGADIRNPDGSWTWAPGKTDTSAARFDLLREWHGALSWRLGAVGPFGPFAGLEAGLQLEGATNPVSQEFKVALGLPGTDSLFAHSLIGGWGVGLWTDDSWFVQYAASRRIGPMRAYASLRGTLQATPYQTLFDSTRFIHHRTWDWQASAGFKAEIGEHPVLPDWILVGATADLTHAGFPGLESFDARQPSGLGVGVSLASGWTW